jgi:predicted ATPase
MNRTTRIYMVGAHSTGKTTMARWVRDAYGLPMISEVARGVLAEMESALDNIRSNVAVVDRYQREVFMRQLACEMEQSGSYVSDRSFCNLAYAASHSTILNDLAQDPRLLNYMEQVKHGLVFFVRPHRELLADDGVRESADWDAVVRIDGMVKFMLEWFGIPYVPVASLSMQERVRLMERVLSIHGMGQAGPNCQLDEAPGRPASLRRGDAAVDATS